MPYQLKQLKKCFLCLSLLFVPIQGHGEQDHPAVAAAIHATQSNKIFRNATIGCYAVNLTQGQVISSTNATKSLIPASTLKLLTTAAALETLGKDYQFKTTLQYDGEVDEQGTLQGNIYIRGGGDPTLGSRHFQDYYYQPHFMHTWVQALQAKGIKKVAGAVIGDAQIYADDMIPADWTIGNLGQYYGAGASGLSIFDNLCTITLKVSKKGQLATVASIAPPLPEEVKIIVQVQGAAIDYRRVCIQGLPYHPIRVIQGEVPCRNQTVTLQTTSPDPTYWAAHTLHCTLQEYAIEVTQPPTTVRRSHPSSTARQDLHTVYSPPLSKIITVLNHDSVDSYAEHLIKHLSLAAAAPGATSSGTKTLKKFWAAQGIDTNGMLLYDGSGLSKYNAITPKQLVEALCYMKRSKNFPSFYASLPIAGKTGNLAPYFKQAPLKGQFRAKSGALSNVRAFAGYGTNKAGDTLAFAIIVNHYDGPRSRAEKALEEILKVLFEQK